VQKKGKNNLCPNRISTPKKNGLEEKNGTSRAPRLARLAVSRGAPVSLDTFLCGLFFSFDRAAHVLSTATAAFLRAGPDQSIPTPRAAS
jgi:hypothetical protein